MRFNTIDIIEHQTNWNMKILLLSFTLISSEILFSQLNDSIVKNLYTFSLVNGINRNATESQVGDKTPENSFGISHGFNFQYSRILHPKFSISGTVGFGFLPLNVKVTNYDTYDGIKSSGFSYFSRIHYTTFSRIELSASYHQKLNNKYELNYQLGGGIYKYANSGSSMSAYETTFEDTNQINTHLYTVAISSNKNVIPFVTAGIGASKRLKNNDLLSLKISYDLSFQNAYNGSFFINEQSSSGKYFNRGNYLNVHLGYTITRNNRMSAIKTLEKDPAFNRKSARKATKKELRYIDPKSSFLSVSSGFGIGLTTVKDDPNGVLVKGGYPGFLARITYEKGIKNNLYWEIGVHSQQFWDVSKFSFDRYGSSGSMAFRAYQISYGAMYRWILKNNYNVINFHAGLTAGVHFQRNSFNGAYGSGGGTFSGNYDGNQINFTYNQVGKVKSNLLGSVYVGLSKDFRIVNKFYLTLNYRHQFGFINAIESTYSYSGNTVPTTTNAKTKINGTSNDFQIGFKLKLF